MHAEGFIQPQNVVNIESVKRLTICANISGKDVMLLYDPGSEYTILPRSLYDSLPSKPPLVPVNHSGVGINNSKFSFDGVAYLNIIFQRPDKSSYTIPYQPVLVSSHISQPIFGIHTEIQFEKVERNHNTQEIILHPRDSGAVKISYSQESRTEINSAYIHVANTTIVKDNELIFVKSDVNEKGLTLEDDGKMFVFERALHRDDLSFGDLKFAGLSKTVIIPIMNCSGVKVAKDEVVGYLNEVGVMEGIVNVCNDEVHENNICVGEGRVESGGLMSDSVKARRDMNCMIFSINLLWFLCVFVCIMFWIREIGFGFAYNTFIHTSIGFTPMEFMFGRKAHIQNGSLYGFQHELARDKMKFKQDKFATYETLGDRCGLYR